MHEELALVWVGEAVELERVLAHGEVGRKRHLGHAVGAGERARRRVDEVADAADVEDKPLGGPRDGLPAQGGDHAVSVRALSDGRVRLVSRWDSSSWRCRRRY